MTSQSGSEGEDHQSQHQDSASPPAQQQQQQAPPPPPQKAEGAPPAPSGNGENGDGKEAPKAASKVSRKRTKTGCLTCRKRRIKCGEERPTCNNCIKSKRVCEGYNQRVVFKDGMNTMVRPGVIPIGPDGRRFTHPYPIQPAPGPQPLPVLAPAPPGYPTATQQFTPLDEALAPHLRSIYSERAQSRELDGYEGPRIDVNVPLGPIPKTSPQQEYGFGYQASPGTEHQQSPPSATNSSFTFGGHATSQSSHTESGSVFGPRTPFSESPGQPRNLSVPSRSVSASFSPPSHQSQGNNCPFNPPMPQEYITSRNPVVQPAQAFRESFKTEDGADSVEAGFQMNDDFFDNIEKYLEHSGDNGIDYDRESEDEFEDEDELAEDSEYRIGSQEDGLIAMEVPSTSPKSSVSIQQQQISAVLEPFSRHLDEHSRISFQSFLPEAGALQAYQPPHSNPLMNPTTAKIFCHFVYVLGPSMSLFERVPPNPHIAFTPGFSAGLHGPQNIWSYTIPMLSLNHPPLLHAILALSALHISKLTNGPDHPSLLHYHIALRRLGKAIASDRHRGHVATLAATLMLAYYETMAAEHDKWSSHIHGAKLLIKDIDFDRVARRIESYDDAGDIGPAEQQKASAGISLLQQRRMRRQMIADDEVDDSFKQFLMGNKQRRQSVHKAKIKREQMEGKYAKKEMETLRLQADLFWWYTKMDCYQSLLSGCPLVLDYIHWDQCPPRSRIGTLGTPYGSSDHYFLLLGRLCDFQVRDLERKKAMYRANGNQWIPPPEMGGPPRGFRPFAQPPPPTPSHDHHQYGMIPIPDQAPHLPSSFSSFPNQPDLNTSSYPPSPFDDLDAATARALQEWSDISAAFEAFVNSLGDDYRPLSIEYMTPTPTPFGPALYYKTYSIASLQMLLLMSSIVLLRCHPDMPPEAMVAASIQAPATARYANDVARIVAGLVPTNSLSETINPALGASLIEASMPVFYAAVQYQQQDQRDWTVRKLREINRLTGWATATRILLGCQRAWEVAAERGRGPPYRRPEMEEEREMYWGYHDYYVKVSQGKGDEDEDGAEVVGGGEGSGVKAEGKDNGRFLWKMTGRRTVDAAGILGDREIEVGGMPF